MRIAIVSAVWGRLPLARVWWAGLARLRNVAQRRGHTVSIWVAGDELHHQALCERNGGLWVQASNDALGHKWNAAARQAWRNGATHLCILGSDDFLADAAWLALLAGAEGGQPHVGLRGIYFMNQPTREVVRWDGYPAGSSRYGAPAGAGRILDARLLDRLDGQPWQPHRMSGLDASLMQTVEPPPAWLVEIGPSRVALDVKYSTNIWGFESLVKTLDLVPVWAGEVGQQLPEWNGLIGLRPDNHPMPVWSPPAIKVRRLSHEQLVAEGLTASPLAERVG